MCHRLLQICAATLFLMLAARALLTFDPYFDTVAYHLPFAARLAGICPIDCYRMGDYLEAAYAGFPKLMHLLQGWVWKLSGSPQYADVLNLIALVLFALFLRRAFRVPAAWTFCALIAVPLIQIHTTSSYVDLPVNLAIAAAILGIYALFSHTTSFNRRPLLLVVLCLAFAANSKPQMIGVAVPLFGAFAAAALFFFHRKRNLVALGATRRSAGLQLYAILSAGTVLIAGNVIANVIAHGNPVYPIELQLGALTLEGPIRAMEIGEDSLAPLWLSVPSPLRWIASVFEIGAYDFRELPWTYDQGYCATALSWKHCAHEVGIGFRMGGYFVPYVLGLLALGAWALRGRDHRRAILSVFVAVTLLAAFLPRSHELRYYMFWMIVLIAFVLIAVFDRDAPAGRQRNVLAVLVLIALGSVIALTHGHYLNPAAPNLEEVMELRGAPAQVATFPEGATVCVDAGRQPFTSLYARVLHAPRNYGVLDGPIGTCTFSVPAPPEE
jgi:hypothetical protein